MKVILPKDLRNLAEAFPTATHLSLFLPTGNMTELSAEPL